MNAAAAASFRAAAELPDRDDEPLGGAEPPAEAPVVKYSPSDAAIAAKKAELSAVVAGAPDLVKTAEGYERVHKAAMQLVPMRTAIEKRRKVLKAESLAYGRMVDAEAHRLTGLIEEIETPLRAALKAADEEKQREADRIVAEEKAKAEAAEKAKRDAEEARLRTIREELEREKARLAEEEAKRDAERKRVEAEQAAERLRLAEEQRKLDEARRAEEERAAAAKRAEEEKLRAEREKIETERRAVREEQERLDRLEFERQARERAAEEARQQAERDRLAAEAAEKARLAAEAEEARRVEAARPDVEKMHLFGRALKSVAFPDVTNDAAVTLLAEVRSGLRALGDRCEAFTVAKRKAGAR